MSQIWIDADATPKKIKEILFRTAQRRPVRLTFVANQYTTAPRISNITIKVVSQGFDKADDYIAENAQGGDLIITADIPLAARCIEKDCMVLTPRGKVLDHNNIGPIHSARNFNEELRNSGIQTKGPASFTKKDIQKFANALDRWVQKNSASWVVYLWVIDTLERE